MVCSRFSVSSIGNKCLTFIILNAKRTKEFSRNFPCPYLSFKSQIPSQKNKLETWNLGLIYAAFVFDKFRNVGFCRRIKRKFERQLAFHMFEKIFETDISRHFETDFERRTI